MRIATKAAILIGIVLAILVVATTIKIYSIDGSSGGYVLWNSAEAYFFVYVSNLGYSATGIEYPWIWFKQHVIGGFAAVEFPASRRYDLVVIRASASGVERHVLQRRGRASGSSVSEPSRFTPVGSRIYADCPWLIGHFMQNGQMVAKDMDDGLCWWMSDHFEKATQDERKDLQGIGRLTDADYENEGGWSRRAFGAESVGRGFTVDVGDEFQLSINNVVKGLGHSTVSIDLLRPAKAPERIGAFDARRGRINKAEYQQVFDSDE